MSDIFAVQDDIAAAIAGALKVQLAPPSERRMPGPPAYEAYLRYRFDPDLPEAHAMLGIVAGHYDYDWSEGERRFRLAVKREPLSLHLRQWYGTFLLYATGRADEARLQLSRVIDEDPYTSAPIGAAGTSRRGAACARSVRAHA